MSSSFPPYVFALIISAGLCGVLAVLAWLRRSTPGVTAFCVTMSAAAVWAFSVAMEALVPQLPTKILWTKIEYLGIVSLVPAWFTFAATYGRQKTWLTRSRFLGLMVIPLLTLALAATNEWHGWIWRSIAYGTRSSIPDYVHGPAFYVYVTYAYILFLSASARLAATAVRHPKPFRYQAVSLVLASLLPWVGHVLYVFDLSPIPVPDLTPFAFALAGLIIAWNMVAFKMFDLIPVGREQLLANIEDGIIVLDATRRIADVNPAARWLLRSEVASPIGQPAELVLAEWASSQTLSQLGAQENRAEVLLDRDPPVWLELYTSPLRDAKGQHSGHLIVCRDITAQKHAEAELRHLKNFGESIIQNIAEGLAISDRTGRISFVNPAGAAMLGYTVAQLVDRTWSSLVPPEQQAVVESAQQRCLAGQAERYETTLLRKAGQQVCVWVSSQPYLDQETGRVDGVLSTFTNISARKRAEEDLRQATLAAEAADRAKGEFLANMSHEIRTPMNAVVGATELLLESGLAAEQHDLVETARGSAEMLLAIIDDILDFSKVEAGKLELHPRPCLLRQVVEDSLSMLSVRAADKNLRMVYHIAPQVPVSIVTDAARLRQILVNLLSNAVKFTERGEVSVSVEVESASSARPPEPVEPPAAEPTGVVLHFAVKDTGIGISQDKIEHLFRPFSQLDTSITRRYGGTGLGLAISKRLLELMGGRIWVESEGISGRGSVFHFTLPTAIAPLAESERTAHSDEAGNESGLPLDAPAEKALASRPNASGVGAGPSRILLVEDNLVNQKVALAMLGKLGYRTVDVANNGLEALELVRRQVYDVVLMDVHMPEMDGWAATRTIRRELPGDQQPRIVAMTAAAMQSDVDECVAAGMNDYISKPVRLEELARVLAQERAPVA